MKKLAFLGCVLILLFAVPVLAEGQPASKATAKVDELVALVTVVTDDMGVAMQGPWTTILSQEIKTPNMKDLFIDASLECGNYTSTKVKSKDDVEDISSANSGVRVRVVIDPETPGAGTGPSADGSYALPDNGLALGDGLGSGAPGSGVTFCRRLQTLSASLQGVLNCPAGVAIPGGCTTTYEEIGLLIETLNANAFNFIAPDLSSGVHLVEVQAIGVVDASAVNGNAEAKAFAGAGSVTIESVRMIKGEDVLDLP